LLWVENFNGDIPMPAILKPEPLWTGKQIISLILPEVNVQKNSLVFKKEDFVNCLSTRDTTVLIERGQLIMGILDKGVVGNTSGGLLHYIWLDHGPKAAGDFLTNAQKVVNNWLLINGFTVGVSDIFPSQSCQLEVEEDLKKADGIVADLFQKAERKELDHQSGKNIFHSFENSVNTKLNNVFKDASTKAQNTMDDRNNIYSMVAAGIEKILFTTISL
jgi:DNA-directed RNA polymerase II subunit RPB1